MRGIQALRRSIKGDKDKPSPASIAHKSALAIVPPKKVRIPNYKSNGRAALLGASSMNLAASRGGAAL